MRQLEVDVASGSYSYVGASGSNIEQSASAAAAAAFSASGAAAIDPASQPPSTHLLMHRELQAYRHQVQSLEREKEMEGASLRSQLATLLLQQNRIQGN